MSKFWMVRAGEGGYLVNDFESAGCVALGFNEIGDFTSIDSLEAMKVRGLEVYPDLSKVGIAHAAAMSWKFRSEMAVGDKVVTYDTRSREYLIGSIVGDYEYKPGTALDYDSVRQVEWDGRVSRDALSASAKYSLGSLLSLFEPGEDVLQQLEECLGGDSSGAEQEQQADEVDLIRRDVLSRSHEFIKDRILALSPEELEELGATILRAMGYRSRVTPRGPDRGRDIVASPDGLGFQEPRIIGEVKHRPRSPIGSEGVRGFVGGLRPGDKGLYISTGGFSREAKYEAERANVPVTLVDLDELATLVVEHYEGFDTSGRGLLPLKRVYWPV